eukprot:1160980-Pelagomonas_calceolata.AAC.5
MAKSGLPSSSCRGIEMVAEDEEQGAAPSGQQAGSSSISGSTAQSGAQGDQTQAGGVSGIGSELKVDDLMAQLSALNQGS